MSIWILRVTPLANNRYHWINNDKSCSQSDSKLPYINMLPFCFMTIFEAASNIAVFLIYLPASFYFCRRPRITGLTKCKWNCQDSHIEIVMALLDSGKLSSSQMFSVKTHSDLASHNVFTVAYCATGCQLGFETCTVNCSNAFSEELLDRKGSANSIDSSPNFSPLVPPFNLRLPYTPAVVVRALQVVPGGMIYRLTQD